MFCLLSVLLLSASFVAAQEVYDTIGFGNFHAGGSSFVAYEDASRHPLYQYSFQFTGYNFTNITALNGANVNSNSTDTWSFNMNYSTVQVGQQSTSNLVYSLTFPEEELPITNASDWQLCAHVTDVDFPSNITNADFSNGGSCLPFLGQECYDALLQSMSTASIFGTTSCPTGPLIGDIPACRAHLGFVNATIGTAGIMNFTDPEVEYISSNHSYLNSRTGENVTTPTFGGLQSGGPYAYVTRVLANNNSDTLRTDATKLILAGLTLTESPSYRARSSASGSGSSLSNNPRLFCGRALKISGPEMSGAMITLGSSSLVATFMALLVSSLL